MRVDDVYIAATAEYVPDRERTADAVARGAYDPEEREVNGYESAGVAGALAAPELAVRAATTALARAAHDAVDPRDIALVLHAGLAHQGQDHWTPASYIQRHTIGGRAPSMEIRQASNGALAALSLAVPYLRAQGALAGALITTADVFGPPMYDRYRSDKWLIFGDGATALVLSRAAGFARVVSLSVDADPTLEEMYRGTEGFATAPATGRAPLDLRGRKRDFVTRSGFEDIALRENTGLHNAVKAALEDADAEPADIDWWVLPNVGRTLLQWQYLDVLGIGVERTSWEWGRRVGHMGAGDQVGGLNHLAESGALGAGDRVALVGSGLGFNWNCAVLEIVAAPPADF